MICLCDHYYYYYSNISAGESTTIILSIILYRLNHYSPQCQREKQIPFWVYNKSIVPLDCLDAFYTPIEYVYIIYCI